MTIKGSLQTTKTNDYGFTSVKMGGAWYGADKKGYKPDAQEGDIVEFEAFKNNKGYDTYKTATFAKVAQSSVAGSAVRGVDAAVSGKTGNTGGSRDTYWADKAAEDGKRDPRISYFASLDRAIQFVDLALRNGAIGAYEKAKATGKLEVLTALVYETTQRIMSEAYSQEVPKSGTKQPVAAEATAKPEQSELVSDLPEDESWT